MRANNIGCPLCKKSIIDPTRIEAQMDNEHARTPMPEEYKDVKMEVMCNDCLTKSVIPFHILPGKCLGCKSYNTTRVENP
jgi:RING finger/CHY zinc finger protein 1